MAQQAQQANFMAHQAFAQQQAAAAGAFFAQVSMQCCLPSHRSHWQKGCRIVHRHLRAFCSAWYCLLLQVFHYCHIARSLDIGRSLVSVEGVTACLASHLAARGDGTALVSAYITTVVLT